MAGFLTAISKLRGAGTPAWLPVTYEGRIELAGGSAATYSQLYRQPWVYAAVNKIARGIGRMPLKAYQRSGDARDRLTNGDLARLTAHPSTITTPFGWKERIIKNTAIYGNAFVVKLGANTQYDIPDELFPSPSIGWTVGEGDTYVWTSALGEKFPFPRWQVIHFRFWDLDEHGFGISMLEPLRRTLAIEDAAQRLGVAAFNNATKPASILKTDQTLKKEVIERLTADMKAIHGGVDNAFKMAVLQQGLDWAPVPSADLNDAAVIDHRKITREEVAAVFDVPQPTIGILDEANFASLDMLHTMLYQDSMGPWISLIEETIQMEFVDMIVEFTDQFVEFDMNSVMRGDISTRYRAYATAIASGFKTPDEIRKLENDPPMANVQPEAGMLHFQLSQSSGAVGGQLAQDTGNANRRTGGQ